jgi:hypothetical protein
MMSHIRILVCRVDDAQPDCMTELAAIDLPHLDAATLATEATLDALEAATLDCGHAALRAALLAQWEAIDAHLVDAYLHEAPTGQFRRHGSKPLTVTSRLGTLRLSRQVLVHRGTGVHVLPGDAALPAHDGRVTTRALQEWACLLAQDLPFATVARLLAWQTHEEQILSPATVRNLVRQHGTLPRLAERAVLAPDANVDAVPSPPVRLIPHSTPRRRAGWPAALTMAVEAALAHDHPCPPRGVSWADWAHVLDARRADAARPAADLRHLGPTLEEGQVLVMMDEVLARAQARRTFIEIRTARIATPAGYRYLTGMGDAFLHTLQGMLTRTVAPGVSLLLIADCARWIMIFFTEDLTSIRQRTLLLDWHHLQVRCAEEASRACRGRAAKVHFLRRLRRHLWRGDVAAKIASIEQELPQARSGSTLAAFAEYLRARQPFIPSYRDRWRALHYIGSGQLEKANDLLVARRQKGHGRHWSAQTSDALAALQTARLNEEWDEY